MMEKGIGIVTGIVIIGVGGTLIYKWIREVEFKERITAATEKRFSGVGAGTPVAQVPNRAP